MLDTHLLIWAAAFPDKLTPMVTAMIEDQDNDLVFSTVSLLEIAIKRGLERHDIRLDASTMRHMLIESGYKEMPFTGLHAVMAGSLPTIHKDPFDRALVAQAIVEGTILLTSDAQLARYPGPIRTV